MECQSVVLPPRDDMRRAVASAALHNQLIAGRADSRCTEISIPEALELPGPGEWGASPTSRARRPRREDRQ